MKKIIVLLSGNGSTLQAIIDACNSKQLTQGVLAAVISNKANAYGLIRAQKAHIATHVIQSQPYSNRQYYDQLLINTIDQYHPDLIVLAGFMRILTPMFVNHYLGKILNIHPSLLPAYPGLHTYQRALENKEIEHGTTVHFVTEQLDGGPIVLQAKVGILTGDNEQTLSERVKRQERRIYPLVINWFTHDRLYMQNNKVWLDGILLSDHGYQFE